MNKSILLGKHGKLGIAVLSAVLLALAMIVPIAFFGGTAQAAAPTRVVSSDYVSVRADSENPANGAKNEGPASYAIDGNKNTWWHTRWATPLNQSVDSTFPHWISLELKQSMDVYAFEYQSRGDYAGEWKYGMVKDYEIYVSDTAVADGAKNNFLGTKAASGTFANIGTRQVVYFDKAYTGKYVTLVAKNNHDGDSRNYSSAGEIAAWVLPQGTPVATLNNPIDRTNYAQAVADSANAATSANAEGPASLAIDGDATTRWHTNYTNETSADTAMPHYIAVELKNSYYVSGLEYTMRTDNIDQPNGAVSGYEVYVSDQPFAEGWMASRDSAKAVAKGRFELSPFPQAVNFEPVANAKYVALVVTSNQSSTRNYYATVGELRVGGLLSVNPTAPTLAAQPACGTAQKITIPAKVLGVSEYVINSQTITATGAAQEIDVTAAPYSLAAGSNVTVTAHLEQGATLDTAHDAKAEWTLTIPEVKQCTHTVTFDYNDDDVTADKTETVVKGETVTKPEDPQRDGYTFKAWQLNEADYSFDAEVTQDITLVAQWTKNPIAVKPLETNVTAHRSVKGDATDPASCDEKPYVTITEMLGVTYNLTVTSNGAQTSVPITFTDGTFRYEYEYGANVAVTATAAEGYVLAQDAHTSWNWSAPTRAELNCDAPQPPAAEDTLADKPVSIKIHKLNGSIEGASAGNGKEVDLSASGTQPLANVPFKVTPVIFTDADGMPISLTNADAWAYVARLKVNDAGKLIDTQDNSEVTNQSTAGIKLGTSETVTTDDSGIATYTNEHPGIFFVEEQASDKVTLNGVSVKVKQMVTPFVVTAPYPSGSEWLYTVHTYPKNTTVQDYTGDLVFKKVGENNKPLAGAVFELHQPGTTANVCDTPGDKVGEAVTSADSTGLVAFDDVHVGTSTPGAADGEIKATYCLVETKAPAGYQKLANAIKIEISNGNIAHLATTNYNDVSNTKVAGLPLPMTGAQGQVVLLFAGIAMALVGVGVALRSKRTATK